ncbi:MAG: bepF 1 [Myxococcaceae bacterium]|nr:bepF 1 [Myxococcaceae bacterium]
MNALPIPAFVLALLSFLCAACDTSRAQQQESHQEEQRKIIVTNPVAEDVVGTRTYVCQIHSRRHIEVRAIDSGYLQQVQVQEGQAVKAGAVMFKIVPVLYKAKLDTEAAEAELAQIKFNNTKSLSAKSIVSNQELALANAELARARAKVGLAQAELNFADLKAPFDGIVDRQYQQQGSLVNEGDVLSTLSDNQVMWVYFNVPEARYLEYKANLNKDQDALDIELKLANGEIFPYKGKIGAIEADFNNETGNIAFRADFPNPDNLLRHGQTGTVLIHQKVPNALVIPQRATFEILANKYVYVVEPEDKSAPTAHASVAGEEHKPAAEHGEHAEPAAAHGGQHNAVHSGQYGVVRQRQVVIQDELDDIYIIKKGLAVGDKIIFEGLRQVRDGDKVEYDLQPAKEILSHLKYHAE